jgi:hypothetical protein
MINGSFLSSSEAAFSEHAKTMKNPRVRSIKYLFFINPPPNRKMCYLVTFYT